MRKLLIFLFVLIPAFSFASDWAKTYSQANEFYKKGDYDTAIVLYEKILAGNYTAPEVYFNLGNAYFKKKDIPKAILNYEKAYKLNPSDDKIAFNLQLAQSMTVDKIDSLPEFFLTRWFKGFARFLSADNWGILSLILFLIFLIFAAFYLFTQSVAVKKSSFWIGIIAILFSIISFMSGFYEKRSFLSHSEAIVMSPSVTVKSSPDEKGNDLFVIHEGLKVWVVDELGDWREIKIADGNKGWLKVADIEVI